MSAPGRPRRRRRERRGHPPTPGHPRPVEGNLELRELEGRPIGAVSGDRAKNGPLGSPESAIADPLQGRGTPVFDPRAPIPYELTPAAAELLELERRPWRVLSSRVALELAVLVRHVRAALEDGPGVSAELLVRILTGPELVRWEESVPPFAGQYPSEILRELQELEEIDSLQELET